MQILLGKGVKMRAKTGFTLVEILIVVVILGILAAIVIPQFTNASTQAKESQLVSDLQTMRSQVELYKIQHNDNLPGTQSGEDFATAMLSYTDVDGVVQLAAGAGIYGPYLQKMPSNPWIADAALAITVTSGTGSAGGDDSSGWYFNTDTGKIQANDSKTCKDAASTPHTSL